MPEYRWPDEGPEFVERVRHAWTATRQALPVGTRVTGMVIGRRPFGVFLRLTGVPDAIGLAEIFGMPADYELPEIGAVVEGKVIGHAEHNHQVRIGMIGHKDAPE
ncbi:hypothetical protein ABZ917_26385 [Nonomuraea wenchangensis]